MLDVMVGGAPLMSGEEAGQRLRRLDPVDDRDHDQDDPDEQGEKGKQAVVPHDAPGYASRPTAVGGHQTATHRSPVSGTLVSPVTATKHPVEAAPTAPVYLNREL